MNDNSLKPEGYIPRIAEGQLARYLGLFGAVEVAGTKWCGKTWTSLNYGKSVIYVDRGNTLDIVRADPTFALAGESPHVIDEWQRVPRIWDVVRHAVDDSRGRKGRWILTGSSTPLTDDTAHSGAGRYGRIRMWPMTLFESGDSSGKVSLAGLFRGEFNPAECKDGIAKLAETICRGGFPDAISLPSHDAQTITREYLNITFGRTIPRLGGKPEIAERLCQSLARNLGQSPTQHTLGSDIYALGDGATMRDQQQRELAFHLSLLERIYLVDQIPGWVPATRSPKRMRIKPKHYFADPSIAIALLGMNPDALLDDPQTLGLALENLCLRDLQVYAHALPNPARIPVRYYHDDSGLEVDAIIECADGSWGGIEIKLSMNKVDTAAANLKRMAVKVQKNANERIKPPAFLAVVVGVGEFAYQRTDGVYVIPIRTLGA